METSKSKPHHAVPRAPASSLGERVWSWLELFSQLIRERRYVEARELFAPGVVAFGTRAPDVHGLPALEREEWRSTWENTTDFRFEANEVNVFGEAPLVAVAATWSSIGYDAQGSPFQRPGRATLALTVEGERLVAVLAHFSLLPGVPDKTYAPAPPPFD